MDSIALFLEAHKYERRMSSKQKRTTLRNSSDIFQLSDTAFKKSFRLNKSAFNYVLNVIQNRIAAPSRSDALSAKDKLAACLRFFGEGSYQHGVCKDYDSPLAQSTFSIVLQEILNVLEEYLCPNWITLKMSKQQVEESKTHFQTKTGFPGVVFCVDGSHIKIVKPRDDEHLFFNRKGYHSLNVLIMCDYKMRIRAVNSNYQGANHDSHVWNISPQRSHFEQRFQNGVRGEYILGDAGYPLEPWLMTPYRTPIQDSPESRYNKSHCKARNVVERTIGLLKNRFRCLLGARQLHYTPQKAAQIVNVCSALHNVCIHFNVDGDFVEENPEDENVTINDDSFTTRSQYHSQAINARNEILQNYF